MDQADVASLSPLPSKRPRLEEVPVASPPPPYGSKEYWEERYSKQFQSVSSGPESSDEPYVDEVVEESSSSGKDKSTLPYHSWYFTYEELRPLLLPLLLGRREDTLGFLATVGHEGDDDGGDQDDEDDEDDDDDDNGILACGNCTIISGEGEGTSRNHKGTTVKDVEASADVSDVPSVVTPSEEQAKDVANHTSVDDTSGDEGHRVAVDESNEEDDDVANDEELDENDDEDAESDAADSTLDRDGLARHAPVTVLEIGCGDVPLGLALALDLQALEEATGVSISTVASNITCTDYSQVVVDMMHKQHCSNKANGADTIAEGITNGSKHGADADGRAINPLQFVVADARQLPYADNSFTMVLEKGTLDAMLSDTDQGVADCIQIVAECARVTSSCIVLISHLNAHTVDGQRWLEEVVVGGLQQSNGGGAVADSSNGSSSIMSYGGTAVNWEIEVHGNSQATDEHDAEDADDGDDDEERVPTGPAVYIIHKRIQSNAPSTEDGSKPKSTVSVKFYSY